MPLRTKRFKILTFLIIIFGGLVIFMYTDMAPDLYFVYWQSLEDTSCHYLRSDDDLPYSESHSFFPTERSIFFHETSCRAGLNTRQACAVEAAARQHPEWEVHVLFSAPVSKSKLKEGILAELLKFGNVKFSRLHIIDYAKGTPLEDMVRDGALNRTRWRISHTSDVVRYLTLYKWGGIYLDLDTVCARPLDGLTKNWAARESQNNVAAGALSFSRNKLGRWVANAAMRYVKVTAYFLNFKQDTDLSVFYVWIGLRTTCIESLLILLSSCRTKKKEGKIRYRWKGKEAQIGKIVGIECKDKR